jgi:anti-sigma factor RsiW
VKAGETELHAYVDGALDAETRRAVEAHLAQSPADAARVAAYLEQRRSLHERYDAVLDEPVPETLRLAAAPRSRARYALAAGWMAAGIAVGWVAAHALTLPRASVASLPRQAAIAHAVYAPEVRHPVEVGADQQEHLVRWLSKRLGTDLKAPALTREGFDLVGGRLLPGNQGGPVAQFMYQDGKGRRLTLYVSRVLKDEGDTAFRYSREDDVSVFYWIDGTVAYALSGALSREDLLAVANVVYKQLNP